jgi:hypothetical protein
MGTHPSSWSFYKQHFSFIYSTYNTHGINEKVVASDRRRLSKHFVHKKKHVKAQSIPKVKNMD